MEPKSEKSFKGQGWASVPATAFKSEEDIKAELKGKKRGKYEEKLAVDISFEDLIKLSVTETKPKSR